jgi:uncharacterized protein YndB with AHSA1/START domain
MKRSTLAAMLCLAMAGPALATSKNPDVADTSFDTPDGARTLQQSIIIDAPVAILWKAFTDPTEFKRWNSPVAAIDMRVGGSMEVSYNPKASLGDPDNIRHRLITFLPERLIVFQNVQAPHALPNADRFQRTVSVIQYEALGPTRTKVTLSCTGWANDPASVQLYHFFETENPEVLETWKHLYETRPKAP